MPKIFLHIGVEKTGSSSIQDFIFSNSKSLFTGGKCYPDYLFGSSNQMELSCLVLDKEFMVNMRVPDDFDEFRRQFIECLYINRENDLYFSSEHLSSRMVNPYDIQCFLDLVTMYGHQIVLIFFLRDPGEWIRSHYLQYIASGGVLTFSEYLVESNDLKYGKSKTRFASQTLKWCEKVSAMDGVIRYMDYEDVRSSLIQSYLEMAELSFEGDYRVPRSNVSLTESQAFILRYLNMIFPAKRIQFKLRRIVSWLHLDWGSISWESVVFDDYLEGECNAILTIRKNY